MSKDEQKKALVQRITLRVSQEMYAGLCQNAKRHAQPVSAHVRGHLMDWLQSSNNDNVSYANIAAIAEILYLVRAMARGFEPNLVEKARAHARLTVKKLMSTKEDVTSCDY